ncbi:hypothetical protein Poli38472_013434 [Pythium oligandrum]|uniref:C3H1-type domain-containing protein n=1 Tax=Pythium oligandrum TaxID=41045 RepID=A0A8K1FC59_PYTOL|nr:hypothetical protein Poli38472_013434 [Pythium oligandrum]|eukprot:TMW57960.1 hypothetical protein Poli38472_013434 [Pythium oligandrum]
MMIYGEHSFTIYRIDGAPSVSVQPGRNVATESEYAVAITIAGVTQSTPFGSPLSILQTLKYKLVGIASDSTVLIEVMRLGDTDGSIAAKAVPLEWFKSRRSSFIRRKVIVLEFPKVAGITKMTEFGPAASIIEPLEFELVDVSNSSQLLVEVLRKGDLERNFASKGNPLTWFEDQRATMFHKNVIAMDLPKGICVHLNCKWKLSQVPIRRPSQRESSVVLRIATMPPKSKPQASKKAEQKRKEQILEDKTFGLKNKNKSSKVQKYVAEVTNQVKGSKSRADRLKEEEQKKKKTAKEQADALKSLFAAAITQPKVPPGVDPKSILCEFFKQGVCTKGARCKFSHDLNVGKKAAKIDLYSDNREDKSKDLMESWDQSKLEQVVAQKHGQKVATTTDIVCKHFLDAIEKSLYGWFWVCPNGGTSCKYRHALPPGYVFKSKKEREAEKEKKVDEISIEEIIEEQRAKLGPHGGTPVTAETLAAYKKEKMEKKRVEEEKKRKEEAKKAGGRGPMSGRALFTYDPTLFRDDADADDDEYSVHSLNEEDDDDEEKPSVDQAAAVLDKSLYLQDADDLDSLKE